MPRQWNLRARQWNMLSRQWKNCATGMIESIHENEKSNNTWYFLCYIFTWNRETVSERKNFSHMCMCKKSVLFTLAQPKSGGSHWMILPTIKKKVWVCARVCTCVWDYVWVCAYIWVYICILFSEIYVEISFCSCLYSADSFFLIMPWRWKHKSRKWNNWSWQWN